MTKTQNYRLNTVCFKAGVEKYWIPSVDNTLKYRTLKNKTPHHTKYNGGSFAFHLGLEHKGPLINNQML